MGFIHEFEIGKGSVAVCVVPFLSKVEEKNAKEVLGDVRSRGGDMVLLLHYQGSTKAAGSFFDSASYRFLPFKDRVVPVELGHAMVQQILGFAIARKRDFELDKELTDECLRTVFFSSRIREALKEWLRGMESLGVVIPPLDVRNLPTGGGPAEELKIRLASQMYINCYQRLPLTDDEVLAFNKRFDGLDPYPSKEIRAIKGLRSWARGAEDNGILMRQKGKVRVVPMVLEKFIMRTLLQNKDKIALSELEQALINHSGKSTHAYVDGYVLKLMKSKGLIKTSEDVERIRVFEKRSQYERLIQKTKDGMKSLNAKTRYGAKPMAYARNEVDGSRGGVIHTAKALYDLIKEIVKDLRKTEKEVDFNFLDDPGTKPERAEKYLLEAPRVLVPYRLISELAAEIGTMTEKALRDFQESCGHLETAEADIKSFERRFEKSIVPIDGFIKELKKLLDDAKLSHQRGEKEGDEEKGTAGVNEKIIGLQEQKASFTEKIESIQKKLQEIEEKVSDAKEVLEKVS